MGIHIRYVGHFLAIGIYADHNHLSDSIIDTIEFNHTLTQVGFTIQVVDQLIDFDHEIISPIHTLVSSNLSFTHFADYRILRSGGNISVNHILSFGYELTTSIYEQIYHNLFLTDYLSYPPTTIADNLILGHSVSYYFNHPIEHILDLVDVMAYNVVLNLPISDTLTLTSSAVGYIESINHYGGTDAYYTTMLGTKRNVVQLSYDNDGLLVIPYTVTLRSPDFGDSNKNEHERTLKRTRGGSLILYEDSIWPKMESFSYKFTIITCGENDQPSYNYINNLFMFLQQSLGKEITLIDHYTRTWTGIVINPNTAIEQVGRFEYSVNIEFEGILNE